MSNKESAESITRDNESEKHDIKYYCGVGECLYRNVVKKHT